MRAIICLLYTLMNVLIVGVCEPECPAEAIVADTESDAEKWVEINQKYSAIWPNISERKEPLENADEWLKKENKLQYLEASS